MPPSALINKNKTIRSRIDVGEIATYGLPDIELQGVRVRKVLINPLSPRISSATEGRQADDVQPLPLAPLYPDLQGCAPTQPVAPQKLMPDADGRIWHPRPSYPDQEVSEPDAQSRVAIQMTTAASQPPWRETNAQRAAELI
jgi:hypothetical protein